MIEYKYQELYKQDSIDKQLLIQSDDERVRITNTEIHEQQFELDENLCSDSDLRFGSCEASMIKFKISNVFIAMKDMWMTVTDTLEGGADEPFQIGRYKVFSDVPTADRRHREVTAYDAMYDIINADVAGWYNSVLPNANSQMTLKAFRTSFLKHFGIEQENVDLVNDTMTVKRTIEPEELSGKDVITAICEINGCFGHINREGKFTYIYLLQNIQGLYPSDDLFPDHAPDYFPEAETGHLYPHDPKGTPIGKDGTYISCKYEDYHVRQINRLQIRLEENNVGITYPEQAPKGRENGYIVENNFLVYKKSEAELKTIAKNMYEKIRGIIYRPFTAEIKGNPCFEVGDAIKLVTKYDIIESYILERNLKGVQALRDTFSANGSEFSDSKLNNTKKAISQLQGETAELNRNLVETEDNLQSQITQNAGQIELRVRKDNIISSINLTPENITIQAKRIDLVGLVNANEFVSKYATIETLNTNIANVNNLIAQKASIDSLNAVSANLINLIAQKASIEELNAVNAKFNHISASSITSGTLSVDRLNISDVVKAMSVSDLTVLGLHTTTLFMVGYSFKPTKVSNLDANSTVLAGYEL